MLNHITIMGRLTADSELRRTTTGKAVVSFTIACDKPGKDSGASFIPCVAWEKTGEFINQYFSKGSAIVLEGRIESRQYETKDNQKRTVIELVASQAHFCGKKEETSDYVGFVPKDKVPEVAKEFEPIEDQDSLLPF